jgi:transposase
MSRCVRGSNRYRKLKAAKARLEARIAARRADRLHVRSTALQRCAAEIEIVAPPSIRAAMASARGTERDPGAEVGFKAGVDRAMADNAAASLIAMLDYKCREAGVAFRRVDDPAHAATVPGAVVAAARRVKRARRKAKHGLRVGEAASRRGGTADGCDSGGG